MCQGHNGVRDTVGGVRDTVGSGTQGGQGYREWSGTRGCHGQRGQGHGGVRDIGRGVRDVVGVRDAVGSGTRGLSGTRGIQGRGGCQGHGGVRDAVGVRDTGGWSGTRGGGQGQGGPVPQQPGEGSALTNAGRGAGEGAVLGHHVCVVALVGEHLGHVARSLPLPDLGLQVHPEADVGALGAELPPAGRA